MWKWYHLKTPPMPCLFLDLDAPRTPTGFILYKEFPLFTSFLRHSNSTEKSYFPLYTTTNITESPPLRRYVYLFFFTCPCRNKVHKNLNVVSPTLSLFGGPSRVSRTDLGWKGASPVWGATTGETTSSRPIPYVSSTSTSLQRILQGFPEGSVST